MKPLNFSVVVVEYFSKDLLVSCLSSVEGQSHQPQKIVVVVNGMDAKEKSKLEKEFAGVHFIDPKANLGYSKAVNLGIANTDSEIILVLNPDTVLDLKCAELACEYLAENDAVASVGPQILDVDGVIYPSARNEPSIVNAIGHGLLGIFKPNNRFSRRYKELDADQNQTREVDWISGAALFLRRKALDEIGGWDEDFFMYCEDVDLGRRLKLAGWKSIYLPLAKISHVGGGSSTKTPYRLIFQHHKSLYIFSRKKYRSQPIMRVLTLLFITIRLPIALLLRLFRIESS